jgi:hypothetical protein
MFELLAGSGKMCLHLSLSLVLGVYIACREDRQSCSQSYPDFYRSTIGNQVGRKPNMFFVVQNYLSMSNLLFFLPELFMHIIPTNSGHIYILVAEPMCAKQQRISTVFT